MDIGTKLGVSFGAEKNSKIANDVDMEVLQFLWFLMRNILNSKCCTSMCRVVFCFGFFRFLFVGMFRILGCALYRQQLAVILSTKALIAASC